VILSYLVVMPNTQLKRLMAENQLLKLLITMSIVKEKPSNEKPSNWSHLFVSKIYGVPVFFKEDYDHIRTENKSMNYFSVIKMIRDKYDYPDSPEWQRYIIWVKEQLPNITKNPPSHSPSKKNSPLHDVPSSNDQLHETSFSSSDNPSLDDHEEGWTSLSVILSQM